MIYTGERAMPWDLATGAWIMNAHVARYAWALSRCYGREVCDLGCGAGYGSYLLSWGARSIVGVDIDEEAIAFARERFEAENLRFEANDITLAALPKAEVYTAFEILEHIYHPTALIDRLQGTLLWSIPVEDGSQYHIRPYSIREIDTLMGRGGWFQSERGEIVQREYAWFPAKYVLGISHATDQCPAGTLERTGK